MSELFDRDITINAGGILIRSRSPQGEQQTILKVTFRVERSVQPEANTAQLSIWNLSKEKRTFLAQETSVPITIEAGYFGETQQIFKGDLEFGSTTRQGADWVTSLQAADGGKQISQSRVNLSFKNVKIEQVLRRLAQEMKVGLGNLASAAARGPQRGSVTEYLKGIVLNGKTYEELERVAKQMGLGVSIQDGQLRFLQPSQVLPGVATVLTFTTGLIGSPEAGEDGNVRARSLLQPDLIPGRQVKIEALETNGFFRVEKSIFLGDTQGTDWYTDIEAKPL